MAALRGSPSAPADALKPLTKVTWISSCTFAAGVNAFAITTVLDVVVGVLGQMQQQQQQQQKQQLFGQFRLLVKRVLDKAIKKHHKTRQDNTVETTMNIAKGQK